MRLAIIGTGYVGLTTGALFADRGNKVTCVDNNENVVEGLKRGEVHIFEPGLKEIVIRTTSSKDLSFTTDLSGAVKDAEIIFLAVGTPSNDDGSFNLKFVEQAARDVGRAIKNTGGFKIVVGKSTVPQGTHMKMKSLINEELGESPGVEWAYVSNPETLAEGTAVANFSKPDRIMIGTESDQAFKTMQELYHPFIRRSGIILRGSSADAELSKLAANAALAMRVAMINEFARIADKTQGADMENVRIMIGSDDRIGYTFLFPSPGYGGSCFPKDVQGLVHQSKLDGYEPVLLDEVHRSNETHKNYLGERVKALLKQKNNPKIAIWGVTFKAKTDDMRDAASIPIITKLVNGGADVVVHDPQDKKAIKVFEEFGEKVKFVDDQYKATEGADALILLTEWSKFDTPNYDLLSETMKTKQLFDLRNRWRPEKANSHGFDYFGIGRNYPISPSQN